jgi:serine/threonine protein kinase
MSFEVPEDVRLVRTFGAGSVFEVALVERGGRSCICKRLKVRLLEEPVALRAFARECEVMSSVAHPAVPELLERGSDARGPWVLQSIMGGVSLRAMVEGHGGGLPADMLVGIAKVAFQTLADVHALRDSEGPLRLVHGDLGPDHLMVGQARRGPGQVGFVDWGMSSLRGAVRDSGERGTLPFVAPEVARGDALIDQANDVYALAATFLYAVLGRDPCRSEAAAARLVEIGERGVDVQALGAVDVDEQLRRALLQALLLERRARLTTALAVLALLRNRLV